MKSQVERLYRRESNNGELVPIVHLPLADDDDLPARPQTRGDCVNGPRPCPWVGCRHHLALDVHPSTGNIKHNFPGVELEDMAETCALDVADRGEVTLQVAGQLMNITRERVRQLEMRMLRKFPVATRKRKGVGL